MKWTIGRQIGAGFVLPVAILVVIGVVAYRSTNRLIETSRQVAHTHKVVEQLDDVLSAITDAETGGGGFTITGDERFLEPYHAALSRIQAEIKRIGELTADNPRQQWRLDALRLVTAAKLDHLKAQIEARRTKGFKAAAELVLSGTGKKLQDEARTIIAEMDNEENDLLKQRAENAEASARNTRSTILFGTLLAFLLVSVAGFFITRGVTSQIQHGVNVLAASASEILATTTQVASGTAETATAVSETTVTVEEVKQTAQVSSQKAKYVAESAQKAVQISQAGKKAVEETIDGMSRIRQQMESIAESIVRLSEQSQAIAGIIATVNDFADQSNLLAVNASIEAAKAGEQGKGFAVVAQEVKNLAEQSKQATAQVRAILNDIQKATSATVMTTEQGSKAVEVGVKQSKEAGESIRVLAESIAEAAQAAAQIAASSQQQLVGMDQVALAMENIKQASTQNVASTRQTETAAQGLHELGQKLKQLVERNRV